MNNLSKLAMFAKGKSMTTYTQQDYYNPSIFLSKHGCTCPWTSLKGYQIPEGRMFLWYWWIDLPNTAIHVEDHWKIECKIEYLI